MDINVVLNGEEKISRLSVVYVDVEDFRNYIKDCDFLQFSFKDSPLQSRVGEIEMTAF